MVTLMDHCGRVKLQNEVPGVGSTLQRKKDERMKKESFSNVLELMLASSFPSLTQ